MAVVRLSDVIVPEVFNGYISTRTTTKSAIFTSGILRSDPQLASNLAGGGRLFQVPFWNDLDNTDPNISNDDPTSSATPLKHSASKDQAVRHNRNQAWSDADLVRELAGSDPMVDIGNKVADYWMRAYQRHLVSLMRGVFADNIANDSSDMVNDIGTDDAAAATDGELISAEAVIDTKQTMGDAATALRVMIMHSVPYARLQKQNLIDFIPDSSGQIHFPTYLGYNLVIDDGCPAIAGTNRIKYWTFLLSQGCIGWAEKPPAVPVEVERAPEKGGGGGVEELWTRKQYAMHPFGIKWTDASCAGQSPTNTELLDATNWDRVYPERKQIGMSLLITNG